MADEPIEIVAPDPQRHKRSLIDLTLRVFGNHSYYEAFAGCAKRYFEGPGYQWADSRVAVRNGRVIGHAGVWRFPMRVGIARLTSAGVGMVMTHPRYRGRGLGREMMDAVMAAITDRGYSLSVLFGILDYYRRFGYCQAWPYVRADLDVDRMSDHPRMLWRRRGALTDLVRAEGAIGRIYNRDYAERVGSAERPLFARNVRTWNVHELIDQAERVRGYTATEVDGKSLQVWEVGGFRSPVGREELLAQLRDLARRQGCDTVKLFLGLGHPLMTLARRRNCRIVAEHVRDGGPMARIVDLGRAVEQLCPELTRRLQASYLPRFAGTLELAWADQQTAVAIRGREVRPTKPRSTPPHCLRGDELVQLLLGSDDPAAVIDDGRFRLTGQARQLAAALFPQRYPYMMRADWF